MISTAKVNDLDLASVKEYLRIDHDEDDNLLSTMLVAAKSFIQSYLNKKFSDFELEGNIPAEFTIACLTLVAHWYDKRELQAEKITVVELPFVFKGLLDLHRVWQGESIPTSV
jgi:uncharacterized phage protein (predicted DNA packaging)